MTIKEIAALAGVSISTVSKIVNNKDDNINSETRNRVLKIVKEYNYTPYGNAKSISNAKSFIIGVLLRAASQSNHMITGILQAAQKHGYNILLFDSQNDRETELKHITALCKNKIDAVIWEPVSAESCIHEHYFSELNIPLCYINAPESDDSYKIDFVQMGYTLTQNLIDFKHTKITCLLKKESVRSSQVLEGFKKCLYDNQIPYNEEMNLYINDEDCFNKIIQHNISGVVSSHFALSLMLYEHLNKLHYYIPSELSLVSLKDDVREKVSFPHISCITIPYLEFGRYVCEKLIQKCEKSADYAAGFLFTSNYALDHKESLNLPPFLRAKKLLVVGSINTDITFNVDWLPQAGKTTTILNATITAGGKGANQAVGAAKLKHEVSLIGKIGNDTDASLILDTLENENVTAQGVHRDMNSQTGKAYIYIDNTGESTITILSGANGNLSTNDVLDNQHLYKNTGFCLISTEIPVDAAMETAKTARKFGAKTILKPATLKCIPLELLKNTDIFIPNRKEAAALCPEYDSVEEQAEYFFNLGIKTVIITLGHEGCYLKCSDSGQYFPASEFTSIDTTGGADAFISALASYLTDGDTIERAVRIANHAAGFCVSRQGVVPALVDKNTLENYIGQKEPELLRRKN